MSRLAVFSLLAVSLASVIVQGSGQQAPIFRSTADNVPVFVTVTDKSGRLVPDLTRNDFEVLDNGKPQPLALFDNSPQPIRLIVMLDVSGSMSGNLRLLREACGQLFARLGPGDLSRVGTFGEQVTISASFTHDAAALDASLPTAIPENAPTPLWVALDTAMSGFATPEGRRVVLVLSDGKDSGPRFG